MDPRVFSVVSWVCDGPFPRAFRTAAKGHRNPWSRKPYAMAYATAADFSAATGKEISRGSGIPAKPGIEHSHYLPVQSAGGDEGGTHP